MKQPVDKYVMYSSLHVNESKHAQLIHLLVLLTQHFISTNARLLVRTRE